MICDGKERFTTFALAERVSKFRKKGVNGKRRPYRCEHCGSYHVGSFLGDRRQRVRGETYLTVRDSEEAFA